MKYAIHLIILMLVLACSNKNKSNDLLSEKRILEPNVLNLAFVYGDGEKIISFPVWFNDSIIKNKKIEVVYRTVYYESDTTGNNEFNITPKKKTSYLFNKDGLVNEMIVGNYYDNRLINTIKATYSAYSERTGYATTKFNETLQTGDFPFIELKLVKESKNLIVFENSSTKTKIYVVPNKNDWKPLVIDTLCKPKEKDIIIWGSIKQPKKIYSVKNLVEEYNIRDFTYENGEIKHIDWTDDPFRIHRTFLFDKNGLCNSFIDSTFSMGGFVIAAEFSIEIKNQLPISIQKVLISGNQRRVIFRETFEYIVSKK